VRIVPPHLVPATLMATGRTRAEGDEPERAVVRPESFDAVTELVRVLKARRPVVLELDRLDDTQRRRAFDFVTGVAYGLDTSMSGVMETKHTFILEPGDAARRRPAHPAASRSSPDGTARNGPTPAPTPQLCVLCDLRPADSMFRSPLDMVIRRDGSRMWSPPAAVCSHCRATTRHWRFTLAWCAECERWGRRSVASPCGIVYGEHRAANQPAH
jgi:hypothetical protein